MSTESVILIIAITLVLFCLLFAMYELVKHHAVTHATTLINGEITKLKSWMTQVKSAVSVDIDDAFKRIRKLETDILHGTADDVLVLGTKVSDAASAVGNAAAGIAQTTSTALVPANPDAVHIPAVAKPS